MLYNSSSSIDKLAGESLPLSQPRFRLVGLRARALYEVENDRKAIEWIQAEI